MGFFVAIFRSMFKLELDIAPPYKKINLADKIYLSGSCFSDEMGDKFKKNKFQVLSNPFGTIYNPYAILKSLGNKGVDHNEIIESQGVFYHWDAHGIISDLTKSGLITKMEEANKKSRKFLHTAQWLMLTFGTAFVYELNSSGKMVANCHKIPEKKFNKRLLSKEEIIEYFQKTLSYILKINPDIHIILTVSPVRHIREGLIGNNRSKSILIETVHELVEGSTQISYFPSYEILIDELRDYRFYSEDMAHPSQQAVDYIWKKFTTAYFDTETKSFMKEWQQIQSAMNHTPLQNKSLGHQEFLRQTIKKLKKLENKVNVTSEVEWLRSQMI